ncbi:MAG: Rod shape-determining protein MreB [Parcubacteria group bacterium GW2011_GWC1_38_17]|uniref:Cell shape-determining protein MreB n=1 Tax=Candidatus Azambacteria bacterium RIFCSPLOWO2_01_FULL_37_9 TaxID=1797297 RepID=A0A1F5C8T3_9BACT|nr:MAG: Rod shape-determining protein MreB [Parcubacteria group bacterium GW2011_GWC2_36_17]KKQ39024.1 MAG: Rod shape-determining protein MreB [Candidatus Moranbacteria bacterium GW2011_GWF2_37_7]KKQ43906.1 MAG: Rod shape-determining protein MreB [Parcubacteria group bacterium GW2011_GWE2_37_8]KKQ59039.1 MAG: Rod shape-determining protein MreB [Parcubacteria group bacterium GW2011_GWC1_38_17]KKQ59654.1 MAG: Rod shape-determining protein MreB [Parcubacteria group bacterium GW2011_GWD1_38_16]OGD
MLNKIFGAFSKDIGIDLGTANTLVYVRGRGIVINEPSVVALNTKTGQLLAIGKEAKRMLGKTPSHISAVRPLIDGVISDFEVTEQMLKFFIDKVHKESFTILPRPRVVIGIPSNITEVEKKAVEDAARNAGAREVYLIEEPMAAAIGSRMEIHEPQGNMIVDIGGGTTDVAIISLGGMVVSRNIKVAGDRLTHDIIQYAKDEYNLLLGERMAEDIKISIGSAYELSEPIETIMRGRDLVSGLPKEVVVDDREIRQVLDKSLKILVDTVKSAIEEAPPELVADIMHNGIVLAGGGSLLRGLDKRIAEETLMPVRVCEDPLTAVVRGAGIILEDIEKVRDMIANTGL